VTIIRPETLVRWHRAGFRRYWRWKSRSVGGRSQIAADLRALIQRMSVENLLWGAPRIHGERLKLGFAVAQSTVVKYMAERGGPFSQGWGTFLRNHAPHIVAMDLFVVPTLGFKLLYVLVIIRLARRELFLRPLSRRRPAPDATRAGVLAAGSVGRTLWGHRSPPRPSRRWSPRARGEPQRPRTAWRPLLLPRAESSRAHSLY
jgi:hypothetical protein